MGISSDEGKTVTFTRDICGHYFHETENLELVLALIYRTRDANSITRISGSFKIFLCGPFLKPCTECYNIASVICFGFWALRYVGS